jgi:hypothetical protein
MWKNIITGVFVLFALTSAQAEDSKELDSEDFLELCQKQLLGNFWFKMSGRMDVRSKTKGRQPHVKVKCAVQLERNKIIFKATLNKTQSFKVEHGFGLKHDTKVLESNLGEDNSFKQLGIKPEDLSFSFMYWDYQHEYKKETLGLAPPIACRVLLLGSPDGSEFVKVWLMEKYKGPRKVEWYKPAGLKANKPYQVIDFEGTAEKNGVTVPVEMKITNIKGDLWVKFDVEDAGPISKIPADLYKTEN